MLEIVIALLTIFAAVMIALYGTWRYRYRIRTGSRKGPAFREWLRNLTEAILGL